MNTSEKSTHFWAEKWAINKYFCCWFLMFCLFYNHICDLVEEPRFIKTDLGKTKMFKGRESFMLRMGIWGLEAAWIWFHTVLLS